jgi:Uma2 family endonuclease
LALQFLRRFPNPHLIPAVFLTARTSQEVLSATMYNSRQRQGNAMATSTHFDRRLTYDDLARMPEDDMRHELIDGVHYVTPSPVLRHDRMVMRLSLAIGIYLEANPGVGEVFGSKVDTVLTRWDVVVPDLVFVAADQQAILTEPNIQGAPALVVEVLSPGTRKRDLGVKKDLFDRGGVREYWVVDPKANTMTIYRRGVEGALVKVQSLPDDSPALVTPLLPGFSLSLEKLFRP